MLYIGAKLIWKGAFQVICWLYEWLKSSDPSRTVCNLSITGDISNAKGLNLFFSKMATLFSFKSFFNIMNQFQLAQIKKNSIFFAVWGIIGSCHRGRISDERSRSASWRGARIKALHFIDTSGVRPNEMTQNHLHINCLTMKVNGDSLVIVEFPWSFSFWSSSQVPVKACPLVCFLEEGGQEVRIALMRLSFCSTCAAYFQ